MVLETNLKNIQQIADKKLDEHLSFRSFLKGQDSGKIDAIVQRLNDEVTPQISCTECGNCCRNLRPLPSDEELIKFVELDKIDEVRYAKSIQCKNLRDNKCTIYLERPEECRSYPYLDRDNFVTRTVGVFQNYEICPIVFNVVELLKIELEWKNE